MQDERNHEIWKRGACEKKRSYFKRKRRNDQAESKKLQNLKFLQVNNLKIENDVLKNEIFDLKTLNSTYLAEAETYKLKYKELKHSNSADKGKLTKYFYTI